MSWLPAFLTSIESTIKAVEAVDPASATKLFKAAGTWLANLEPLAAAVVNASADASTDKPVAAAENIPS
jgi:hypothetical protein